MMPIGPLMIEHRLLERMIKLLGSEIDNIAKTKEVNVSFIENAIDFIKTYADRCHHGKEEDILFRELKKKNISSIHNKIIDELIQEHIYAREITRVLSDVKNKYSNGDKDIANVISAQLDKLVKFYPKHIAKEDKNFFIPCMEYFTRKEQDDMLDEFWEFDKKLIHEKYRKVVELYE
ncbi:MAG: hemerythrin domain-containing protein [Actinobacteria bacterium]|nr:hemerythrin domain-containing protein [Actinomycetota bacterium]